MMLRIDHDNRPIERTPESTLLAEEFYPLRPGNEWVYEVESNDGTHRQEVRIERTESIRGDDWAVVEVHIDGNTEGTRALLRTDGSLLLEYRNAGNGDRVLVDFSRTKADRGDSTLGFVEATDLSIDAAGVSFEDCVRVATGSVENEVGTYAPGVGLVESRWLQGRKVLVRARIDGLDIPN